MSSSARVAREQAARGHDVLVAAPSLRHGPRSAPRARRSARRRSGRSGCSPRGSAPGRWRRRPAGARRRAGHRRCRAAPGLGPHPCRSTSAARSRSCWNRPVRHRPRPRPVRAEHLSTALRHSRALNVGSFHEPTERVSRPRSRGRWSRSSSAGSTRAPSTRRTASCSSASSRAPTSCVGPVPTGRGPCWPGRRRGRARARGRCGSPSASGRSAGRCASSCAACAGSTRRARMGGGDLARRRRDRPPRRRARYATGSAIVRPARLLAEGADRGRRRRSASPPAARCWRPAWSARRSPPGRSRSPRRSRLHGAPRRR